MQHGIGELIGDFYERVPTSDRSLQLGQFCWAPIPYIPPRKPLVILDLKEYDPRDESMLTFRMVTATASAFKDRHVPIKAIDWETDEEIIPLKAKMRPAIVVSCEQYSASTARTPDNLLTYLMGPVYTVNGHDPAFIARLKSLEYNQFFWLAEDTRFNRKEALVRLDRIQPVNSQPAEITNVRLSESAWMVLRAWIIYYLTGDLDSDIADIRRELLKQCYT